MKTELAQHIETVRLCDTHEHLRSEENWVNDGLDILQDLFGGNYASSDLVGAGASEQAIQTLLDASNPDIGGRFRAVEEAWRASRFTGYCEAVRIHAQVIYGLSELTAEGLESAQSRLLELRRPGERLRLLRDVAHLDHVQVDNFCWPCLPDRSGPDFFFYDLNWANFCNGRIHVAHLLTETGIEVNDLDSLDEAMTGLFAKYGPCAVAVKSNHAYDRTLHWQRRAPSEASACLKRLLTSTDVSDEDRLCVGDWCWGRGVELAIEHNLPFKLHTGYCAGHGGMRIERINPALLCPLLREYPKARFVLMHIGYPYQQELLALAKHYPNIWVDLCWAWSINPRATEGFVDQFLHTVPINKLLVFGGDSLRPTSAVAYAIQARHWLTRALQSKVASGDLAENDAIETASRLMRENQYALFDLDGKREAIDEALRAASTP